ncbi:hypothetical protein BSKO_08439 [Bryopsis sp. KO-2023]|nr:hypothetical protein BSKO_08439 [Bryopsis sp. KO-2023]
MPRYYCDYCDTYLTHDSPAVRKQHNLGYKHKANVRNYYMQFEEQHVPTILDSRGKEYDARSREAFQAVVAANFLAGFGGARPMGPPPVRPGAPIPPGPRGQMRPPMGPRPPFQFRGAMPPPGNPPPMPFPPGVRMMGPPPGQMGNPPKQDGIPRPVPPPGLPHQPHMPPGQPRPGFAPPMPQQ